MGNYIRDGCKSLVWFSIFCPGVGFIDIILPELSCVRTFPLTVAHRGQWSIYGQKTQIKRKRSVWFKPSGHKYPVTSNNFALSAQTDRDHDEIGGVPWQRAVHNWYVTATEREGGFKAFYALLYVMLCIILSARKPVFQSDFELLTSSALKGYLVKNGNSVISYSPSLLTCKPVWPFFLWITKWEI